MAKQANKATVSSKRTSKVLPDLTQEQQSNVNPLDADITALMEDADKQTNVGMKLTKFLFDGAATFDDVFLGSYAAQKRSEKIAFIDNRVLREVSPHYGEVLDTWLNNKKTNKSPSEGEKAIQDKLSDKLDAPRMTAKRALQGLAYLRSVKAHTLTIREDGSAKIEWNQVERDEKGNAVKTIPMEDIFSGRALARKGAELLPKGVSGRTGTGAAGNGATEQANATQGLNLTSALGQTSKLLADPKAKLNAQDQGLADTTLINLVVREFSDNGDVDSKAFIQWCREHGLKVDGKEPIQPMSAEEAEKMEHKAVSKTVAKAANKDTIKTAAKKLASAK